LKLEKEQGKRIKKKNKVKQRKVRERDGKIESLPYHN
jgi:hypothetical protein